VCVYRRRKTIKRSLASDMFDQMKMAREMMKNMSPDEVKDLMEQAKNSKKMMEEEIARAVEKEISERGLMTRGEVERMIRELT
jgi:polyhydroxyalkanoate synthesis regulator phasin